MRKLFAVAGIVLLPLLLAAQSTQTEYSKVDAFAGYSYLRNSGNGFNGWEGQLTYNFNHFLGATADFSGHYRTAAGFSPLSGFSASANQRMYTFLFGPTATARFGKHDVFAHALFGGVHSSVGAGFSIPILGSFNTGVNDATAFGMALGGGVDIGLSRRFAIRAAQVDYLYTHFNTFDALTTGFANNTNNHQNSFRYSAGIVFRF
ncbi:MAG: hypothetical protein ACJ71N_00510 [Terriglobales bacterium]|jgi:opacity protein-like surface antigen